MRRFLLFSFHADQPLGGMRDYVADFDSVEQALNSISAERRRYYQIVDGQTMGIVKEGLSLFKRFAGQNLRSPGRSASRTE